MGACAFANAAFAPLQGRLVDRFGRVRVLAPIAAGQALVLVVAGALAPPPARPGPWSWWCSALPGTLVPPIAATVRALLGEVFPDAGRP